MTRALASVVALLVLAGLSPAQVPPIQPIVLTVRPAAEPTPALKYHLLPWPREQHRGNAALHYHRAALLREGIPKETQDKFAKFVGVPLKDLPPNDVRPVLRAYKHVLEELNLGAHASYCDWQLSEQIRQDTLGILLPEVQRMREFAALLQLKARLEIAEGRTNDAAATLQTGFALSRHISQMPTLISALVGIAISSIMAAELDNLVQVTGAPNFYWALTDLPRPFIDLRETMQTERHMADSLFPGLRELADNPRAAPLSTQQLEAFTDRICKLASDYGGPPGLGTRAGLALMAAKLYPEAKRYLVARGRTAAEVDAMPIVQAALLYQMYQYDEYFDEMVKWQGLPLWEARPGLLRADRHLKQERARYGGLVPTLATLLLPAMQKVFEAQARIDRKIAALRCVEAIRLYAAAHDGKLPLSLSDIQDVPVPIDPVTGKPFQYVAAGNQATLTTPLPPGEQPGAHNTIRYDLTFIR
jgi:hypothetical protein